MEQLAELNDKYLELKVREKSEKIPRKVKEDSKKEKCNATVIHTVPFFTYIHNCNNCHYVITESDWELTNKEK
jgi:hypothetical protein